MEAHAHRPRRDLARTLRAWLLVVGIVAGCARSGTGPSEPPASRAAPATAPASCSVTRPEPPFVPPSRYPATPPESYGAAWFGSAGLWTMLSLGGEAWADLPRTDAGLGQKTFWWSEAFSEPDPAIGVTGERLDGPGSFKAGYPGTNADADFGPAMLVGVIIPSPGCWRISATYRGATLDYIVWVALSED